MRNEVPPWQQNGHASGLFASLNFFSARLQSGCKKSRMPTDCWSVPGILIVLGTWQGIDQD
ncbi:hypothetical protein [Novosphingobium sediminis]|uniref:hypothetical protein n=1 Tax=Novosphingobium sediminis TaxID=707214 RepID=UPI0011BEED1C|nr:hypothetical protein [Novosphingobium sediminis]